MANTLHILNGESTLSLFNQTKIEGDTFVWQEVLSEGPTEANLGSDSFWSMRSAFMCDYFDLTEEEFTHKAIDPFKELERTIHSYEEIVLWFEYDLFCQVNMIALISWLGQSEKAQVSLICVGQVEGHDKMIGLGEIPSSTYPQLFESRVKLNTREFTHAQDAWETYCSTYPDDLYNFILLKMEEFQYLPQAFEAHLKRFPFSQSGLNEIEQKVIALYLSGYKEDRKIVGQLLKWQDFYGFGDLQYFNLVENLKPLLEHMDNTSKAASKEDVQKLIKRDYMLGGANVNDWIWDENEKALIPKKSMP